LLYITNPQQIEVMEFALNWFYDCIAAAYLLSDS